MSKFNKKEESEKIENLAGGSAYKMSKELELVHAVLATFLEDKFYETGNKRLERIKGLAENSDPLFVANLAVIARKEFNLRSVSTALIGILSKMHRGDDLIKRTIVAATQRVDDLTELVSFVGTPIPKQVKRGIRNAILKFSRYQLSKYKAENKKVSLVDLFNLTHPKAQHANEEQKKAWADLMKGKLVSEDTWESEISNAKDDKARTKEWERLIREDKIGYMALLRNLNNLVKYNVSDVTINRAIKKLTDKEEVKNSKQLPFRFMTAYENVKGNRRLTDAISLAMDSAVDNTPEFSGDTLIAIDSSGSMSGDPIKKASIFGATLYKTNSSADLILYDTKVKEVSIGSRIPVVDLAQSIEKQLMGGGTHTSLVFDYAIQKNKKYDRIIIISDNESWGDNVQGSYENYRKISNPFVYAIDIQGYGTKDMDGSKVFHLTGWSDRLLDFIGRMEKGDSLVSYIRSYKIGND